jgi:hypothetical protein
MELLQTEIDSISYLLDAGIESGQVFRYLLSVDNGDFIVSDTITKIFGTEIPIFEDDGEDMQNWTSAKWNITSSDFHSPVHSITDSPSGNYTDDANNIIKLDTVIDLQGVSIAFLRFWAKWEIEAGFDFAQLQIKEISTNNWITLPGKYTKAGSSYQDQGKPLYDGFQNWVQEEIDISSFAGKEIECRFRLVSDSYLTEDGFYFDDFAVTVVSNTTGVNTSGKVNDLFVSDAYPNPANHAFSVQYNLNQDNHNFRIELFDAVGNCLISKQLDNQRGMVKLNILNLASGIYFYRITDGNVISISKKLIKY